MSPGFTFVPGIHVFLTSRQQDVDGRDKPGHDVESVVPIISEQYFAAVQPFTPLRIMKLS
jgi:hypothetical protein